MTPATDPSMIGKGATMVRRGLIGAATVAALVLLLGTASADASTGSLTSAYANTEWTKASFNVSVSATPCLTGSCTWSAIVMAQPNLPSYSCPNQEWADSDPNTQEVWISPQFQANGSYSATVTEAPILNRVNGQRLCLEIFGQNEHVSAVCESQRKVFEEFFHEPQPPCQPEKFIYSETLGSALLTLAPPSPAVPAPAEPAPSTTPAVTTKPKVKPLVCPKGKRKVVRKGKQVCVKKAKRRHHRQAGK